MDPLHVLGELGISLAIGLLVGTERGWVTREAAPGSRVAGIRTFGLIGLFGGLSAVLARAEGVAILVVAMAALAALIIPAYVLQVRETGKRGVTTEVASLLTFLLAAAPPYGYGTAAAAGAGVTVLLLGLKPTIHRLVERLEEREIYAALKLLFLVLVLLPVLPDQAVDPWGVLNPREILWMVILIAGISFAAWFAVRMAGPHAGLGLTALLGGLVSSTAVTLNFSRMGRDHKGLQPLLAAGIVAACAAVFPRMLIEVGVVEPSLLPSVGVALGTMAVVAFGGALILWVRRKDGRTPDEMPLKNPLELSTAIRFAAMIAVILLLAEAAERWLGSSGVYALAAVAGIGDVDAITLSLARQTRDGLDPAVASRGILIAAAVNTAVKIGFVVFIAGGAMARRVGLVLGLALLAGAMALLVDLH